MPGTTTHGWPYVLPADHPKEYPAASQALANKLEADMSAVGGFLGVTGSVPSAQNTATAVTTVVGTPTLWGGMTTTGGSLWVPVAGLYRIAAHGAFGVASAGTIRAMFVGSSGGAVPAGGNHIGAMLTPIASAAQVNLGVILAGSGVWSLAANAPVTIFGRQDNGTAVVFNGTLTVELIR